MNMRKSKIWILGLVGGAILLVGVLAGTIFGSGLRVQAATPTPSPQATMQARTDYCKLYEQTLANNLGVSVSKLESANQAAARTVINQMAKEGTISASQQSDLESRLRQYSSDPCRYVTAFANEHIAVPQALAANRAAIESDVAAALKMSPQALDKELASGKTIPQIAQAQHVPLSDVNTAYLAATKTQLDKAVASGQITKEQQDAAYQKLQQAVQMGHYPFLERGKAQGGGMMPSK
jgi:hypothetical protein